MLFAKFTVDNIDDDFDHFGLTPPFAHIWYPGPMMG